jgi:hypothetical protein
VNGDAGHGRQRKVSMKVVVAVLATMLVVGAGSVEAARLVTGATIKNNSVTGKDIKNGSLTLRDFKRSERSKLRGRVGPAGPQGANGTTDITYVNGPVITVGPGASAGTYALCPAGSMATGGGIGPATQSQLLPIDAYTISGGGFGVLAQNPDSTSRTLQARAACARR